MLNALKNISESSSYMLMVKVFCTDADHTEYPLFSEMNYTHTVNLQNYGVAEISSKGCNEFEVDIFESALFH